MARIGISEEQVIAAAQELASSGQAVTVSAVREVIGSGSFSTINGHLAKWRESGGGARPVSDVPDMPESVARSARAFWGTAWNEAQQAIKGEREALDAARRGMDVERRDMASEIARLETENSQQAAELVALRAQLAQVDGERKAAQEQAQGLRVENARLDERAKAAEGRGEGLQQELDKLHARLQELAQRVEPKASAGKARKKSEDKGDPES